VSFESDSYVIYMSGVFDTRRDTISFSNLVRDVKKAARLTANDAKDAEKALAQARPAADKLKILRDKAFAHRSAHISYNDVFAEADVTPDELRNLTDLSLDVANRLLVACGLPKERFTPHPKEYADAMMKALANKPGYRTE